MAKIDLWHGSDHIIETPKYLFNNDSNDFGTGFYCSTDTYLAQEWACHQNTDGIINHYSLETNSLRILNLLDNQYSILNWLALLLKHRTFLLSSPIAVMARNYILKNFSIDLTNYDVVMGYQANGSAFSFTSAFLQNKLPLQFLAQVLQLSNLGEQTVLISEKAFTQLTFTEADPVDRTIYYPQFINRDYTAQKLLQKKIANSFSYQDDTFIMDLLRKAMKSNGSILQ